MRGSAVLDVARLAVAVWANVRSATCLCGYAKVRRRWGWDFACSVLVVHQGSCERIMDLARTDVIEKKKIEAP
eukprot:6491506-Amphidinium_carterae.5